MKYQLRGLEPAQFEPLFQLDADELAERGMRWMRADKAVGFPCRISLEDAAVGEDVLLLPFAHQDSRSPYRASGPIFVRRGVRAAAQFVDELPLYLTRRPLSIRAYDAADEMIDADVIDGSQAEPLIEKFLGLEATRYLHIHFAKRGCYACRVEKA